MPAASRVSPSRSTRGCVQNNRGHPHSQRPRLAGPGLVRVISSKGSLVRLVLVEALDQRVHVLCHKHICAAAPGFFSTSLPRSTHSLAAASLTSTMRQQLAAANMAPVARAAMYPQARGSVVIVTAKPRSRSHVPMAARVKAGSDRLQKSMTRASNIGQRAEVDRVEDTLALVREGLW